MKKFLPLILLLFGLNSLSFAQKATKIWIVRHAEKQTIDPKNNDPELTEIGEERALALADYLKNKKISHIFSSKYLRTMQTALPIVNKNATEIEIYDAGDSKRLVGKINELPNGKNILIVGHSNTVIDLVKALGAETTLNTLTDDDYDFIFELKIKGNQVKLKINHFGEKHHSTTKTTSQKNN